jgi:DNA polymerase-3 subunit delta
VKIAGRDVEGFLRAPGAAVRVVLLYGDDEGLIRERARALVDAELGGATDPFRLSEVGADQPGALEGAARTGALLGGRRIVRVRQASDSVSSAVTSILSDAVPSLTILEAPGLPARAKLRGVVEASPAGAAIGCYVEDDSRRAALIRNVLSERRVAIDPAALAWLSARIGGDRATIRNEVERLALFAGPAGRLDLEGLLSAVGDFGSLSAEDTVYAALAGDAETTDRALRIALFEGLEPVAVVRMALSQVQLAGRCRVLVESGVAPAQAVKAARPPIFFRRLEQFRRAIDRWSFAELEQIQRRLVDAERACKSTGVPGAAVCQSVLLSIARQAAEATA